MKKLLTLALAVLMCIFAISALADTVSIDRTLELQFVPSKDADVIITGTKNLPELLKAALLEQGYDVKDINITVGTNYEATGEAMAAGTVDLGWLPGGTYALFSDDVDVILTATRAGLSNDSEDPTTWNGEANKTLKNGPQVTFYRSLIYATPSAYGKELAAKVNAGEALTWDDLSKANWAVLKNSSSAGYIYPTLWLQDHYEKKITDLPNVITLAGYGDAFAQAAAEAVDIIVCYADGRNDYEAAWTLPTGQSDETGKAGMGRTINRMIDITEGELTVDGTDVSKLSGKALRKFRRKIGMIFQSFNLVTRATALKNVLTSMVPDMGFFRVLFGMFTKEQKLAALAALDKVGILDKAYIRCDQLSGGQQQRVALARTLNQNPSIILADEPVAALDPVTAHQVMADFKRINEEMNITILINIHHVDLALGYAQRVVGIRAGEIVYDGPASEVTQEILDSIYNGSAVPQAGGN